MNKSEIEARISELKEEIKQLERQMSYIKIGVFLGLWGDQVRVLILNKKSLQVFDMDGSFILNHDGYIWLDDYTIKVDGIVTYTSVQHVIVPASLKRLIKANEA